LGLENRIKEIKRDVDKMYVILPFEKIFMKKHNYPVTFVGHPLIDAIHNQPAIKDDFRTANKLPIIALLPGVEITKMLSIMLSIVVFPDYQFIIAGAQVKIFSFYEPFITNTNIKFISNKTYDLLKSQLPLL
jgi:lipid-A-disaccharide synthase